jgi:sec-independent protein translocase protein TatC
MPVWDHLAELRRRLTIAAAAYVVAACIAAAFYNRELGFLQHPYCQVDPLHCGLYVTGPLDPLTLRVKLAAFGGLVLATPVILWEFWRFVTPGLRSTEKRYAVPFCVASATFFALGCLTAYLTFPHTLRWLIGVGGPDLHTLLNPNAYLSLILLLMFMFGLAFEFPVVLVALELVGVVSPAALLRSWRWAVLGITVCAAVLTPSSDPFSMLALLVPLVIFYFMAIGIGKVSHRMRGA